MENTVQLNFERKKARRRRFDTSAYRVIYSIGFASGASVSRNSNHKPVQPRCCACYAGAMCGSDLRP